MRNPTKILVGLVVLAAAGWSAGCNGTIDTEPDVVLEVASMTIPPVAAATAAGVCTFTITNANATFNNKPKNHLAGATPFNDIILSNVVVDYVWDDGAALVGQQFGIGGTVPADGSSAAQFTVVNDNVLSSGATSRGGHTASLTLTFNGTTVSGDPVSVTTGGTLTVNSCPP